MESGSDQPQQTFAVSHIRNHRCQNGSYQYLVRWKDEKNDADMNQDQDTWEPTTSFVDGEQSSAIQVPIIYIFLYFCLFCINFEIKNINS